MGVFPNKYLTYHTVIYLGIMTCYDILSIEVEPTHQVRPSPFPASASWHSLVRSKEEIYRQSLDELKSP